MKTEKEKMLAGEMYNPADHELSKYRKMQEDWLEFIIKL